MKTQLIRNAALRLAYAIGVDPFLAPKPFTGLVRRSFPLDGEVIEIG